jgi:hypothetical protein
MYRIVSLRLATEDSGTGISGVIESALVLLDELPCLARKTKNVVNSSSSDETLLSWARHGGFSHPDRITVLSKNRLVWYLVRFKAMKS